jgi:DNA replication protein DnaC
MPKAMQLILYERKEVRPVEIDKEKKEIIKDLYDWSTSPIRKPCLIISGAFGCGKTLILEAFMLIWNLIAERNNSQLLSIEKSNNLHKKLKDEPEKMIKWPMIIDELGREPQEGKIYGETVMPMRRFLEERYDNKTMTLATTNLKFETLCSDEYYGQMLGDRFRQTFINIIMTGKSMRK